MYWFQLHIVFEAPFGKCAHHNGKGPKPGNETWQTHWKEPTANVNMLRTVKIRPLPLPTFLRPSKWKLRKISPDLALWYKGLRGLRVKMGQISILTKISCQWIKVTPCEPVLFSWGPNGSLGGHTGATNSTDDFAPTVARIGGVKCARIAGYPFLPPTPQEGPT